MYGAINVFIVCTVLANFTLDSFLPLGGFFLVNVGTLFFGITFTQRDRVHRFGRTVVYRMIAAAALANVIAALAVGTPLRYVAVSFLAIVVSEAANTEVYHNLLHRRWFTRVASSNAVAAPLDTIIFTTLAFAGEAFATTMWMIQVIVTDVIVKYTASLVAAVTIMSRPEWLPRVPGEGSPSAPAVGGDAAP
jgi:queuosine precursor transporter